MLRLFFGRHLGPDMCRSLVLDARANAVRQLAGYEVIGREIEADPGNAEDRPYWLLTVAAGKHTARASVAWADEALAALDAAQDERTKEAP
jgi:hypothetical protein